jgi:hypothetical protein
MDKLLYTTKRILELNPKTSLTGTLMLKLRGIDLGREPKDIDILKSDTPIKLKFPSYWNKHIKIIGKASDGSGVKYKYKSIIIDVIGTAEEPELIQGIRCGTLKGLMDAKYLYSHQKNESSFKHYSDLVKMGFKFPEKNTFIIDNDELPF